MRSLRGAHGFLCGAVLLLVGALLSGCGDSAGTESAPIRLEDSTGQQVELARRAERVVLLAPSLPNIVHGIGGDFAGWADSPGQEAPPYAAGKPTVGYTYQVSPEKVIVLKPDLAVGIPGLHSRVAGMLSGNGVPVLLVDISTYDGVRKTALLLGEAMGRRAEAEKAVAAMDRDMEATVSRYPDRGLTCAILHGMSKAMVVEGRKSLPQRGERSFPRPTGGLSPRSAVFTIRCPPPAAIRLRWGWPAADGSAMWN